MVGTECDVAALTLMTDRDDTATVDPRTAARKRALATRFVLLVVKFMGIYNLSGERHDLEVNEILAIGPRTRKENCLFSDVCVIVA
jgi:hypothetical protein